MNNNNNKIRKFKERVLNNFCPVYHAPLVFDINTQSCYRKAGYVAWPKTQISELSNIKEEEKVKNISRHVYFAYPENKSYRSM